MIRPFSFNSFLYILSAVQWTLALSALAFIGGALLGAGIALLRTDGGRYGRMVAAAFITVFQGTPLLMQLFLVFFGVAIMGVDVSPWSAALIGLTLHAGAYLGAIWRGAIDSVPAGQREAGRALGLGWAVVMTSIVVPQAVRVALPPTVGFLVQLVKATSVTSIIGFVELTRAAQIINNATFSPFLVFGIVAGLYFALCWPLSLTAQMLERRFDPARSGRAQGGAPG